MRIWYDDASRLDAGLAGGAVHARHVDPPEVEITILRSKECSCAV